MLLCYICFTICHQVGGQQRATSNRLRWPSQPAQSLPQVAEALHICDVSGCGAADRDALGHPQHVWYVCLQVVLYVSISGAHVAAVLNVLRRVCFSTPESIAFLGCFRMHSKAQCRCAQALKVSSLPYTHHSTLSATQMLHTFIAAACLVRCAQVQA
jgi:hypothetical protein